MKRRQHEVFIVLGALIALSFGIGLLHGDEKNNSQKSIHADAKVSLQQLEPLMEARSVEKIAKSLSIMPKKQIETIVRKILSDKNTILSRNDKIALISALSTEFQRHSHYADSFFELLAQYPDLITKGDPILYVMARLYYDPIIPRFINWLSQHKPQGIPPVSQLLDQAAQFAIGRQSSGGGKRLFTRGLAFTKEQLNHYLWQLVHDNGNPKLIEPLVKAGADINTHFFGTTPLFNAVKNNNSKMVIALINAGADVNYVADKSYGSPIQEAIGQNLTSLELLLRRAGARE